jgi:histidine triad (HIT) family protein
MLTSDPDCPFCQIVSGADGQARVVFRNADVVAFFPTEPATLGHTLVVPRVHVPDIWLASDEVVAQLARAAKGVAGAIRRAIRPDGLNVIQSNGEAATQTIMHMHVHVVPRWFDDAVGRIWPTRTDYSDDQKDLAWGRLRLECETI